MKILNYILILYSIIIGTAYRVSPYESAIGRWKLLYSDNFQVNSKHIDLCIEPDEEQLKIKIKRYENENLVTIKKLIICTVDNEIPTIMPDLKSDNNCETCTLILLKSQKFIKSIGIFEFPYFALDYRTGMYPRYVICWKYNAFLGRLYINIDNYTYVFEKNYYDKFTDKYENITMNTFLVANIISFLFGKLLEKTIHLQ
jgi:hypothetical protein